MSGVQEKLAARLGGNIMESMGAGRSGGFALPTSAAIPEESAKYQGCARIKSALLIPVDRLAPDPNQPRKEFEDEPLRHLADSLRERGQLQPIRVRWDTAMGRWVIIAGERRWRASAPGFTHQPGASGGSRQDRPASLLQSIWAGIECLLYHRTPG